VERCTRTSPTYSESAQHRTVPLVRIRTFDTILIFVAVLIISISSFFTFSRHNFSVVQRRRPHARCSKRCTNFLLIDFVLQSFCCVDKKGVLSWPNPTAEKVFILTSVNDGGTQQQQQHSSAHRPSHPSRHHSKRPSTAVATDILHTCTSWRDSCSAGDDLTHAKRVHRTRGNHTFHSAGLRLVYMSTVLQLRFKRRQFSTLKCLLT